MHVQLNTRGEGNIQLLSKINTKDGICKLVLHTRWMITEELIKTIVSIAFLDLITEIKH